MCLPYLFTLILVGVLVLPTSAFAQTTLEKVKARGTLVCGVHTGLAGFAARGADGRWRGFDVDYCRAVAAAIFDDANKVDFRPLSAQDRFPALQAGEIDVLSRNTTRTLSRDASLGLAFGPILFYDGQGMMMPVALHRKLESPNPRLTPGSQLPLKNLNGLSICVQSGTTTAVNLADFFRRHQITYTPMVFATPEQAFAAYDSGRCKVVTSDVSQLLAWQPTLTQPDDHAILNVVMSKEPLAPVVRQGDHQWVEIITWVAFGLIEAEEQGVASDNVLQLRRSTTPAIRFLLGSDGNLGTILGLRNYFMVEVIRQVGNYGEIFDRNLRPLNVPRALNALWTAGGLLYAPPFR